MIIHLYNYISHCSSNANRICITFIITMLLYYYISLFLVSTNIIIKNKCTQDFNPIDYAEGDHRLIREIESKAARLAMGGSGYAASPREDALENPLEALKPIDKNENDE